MKILASGGTLILDDNYKKDTKKWTERNGIARQAQFTYTKTFDWHFCYCHIVDNCNILCHASPALEETLITKWWTQCVFTFLLAMAEVDLYLVLRILMKTDEKTATYWISAKNLIGYWSIILTQRWNKKQWKKPWCSATSTSTVAPHPMHANSKRGNGTWTTSQNTSKKVQNKWIQHSNLPPFHLQHWTLDVH